MPPTQTDLLSNNNSSSLNYHHNHHEFDDNNGNNNNNSSSSNNNNSLNEEEYIQSPQQHHIVEEQEQDVNNNNSSASLADFKQETIIVFDWDDTLLSSSWLAGLGYRLDSNMSNVSPLLIEALTSLSDAVCDLLKLATQFGKVCIITNAETGWVELSAQKFIPNVLGVLNDLQIQIISARSTYEPQFPDQPLKWKCCAFEQVLGLQTGASSNTLNNINMNSTPSLKNLEKNVLSFGDSHVEREAVRTVTNSIDNTLCKSVKFAERPTCEQLTRQITLVNNCFSYIHNHANHLDLQLTVTVNDNANNQQEQQRQQELNEKLRCQEQSNQQQHDDGCSSYIPNTHDNSSSSLVTDNDNLDNDNNNNNSNNDMINDSCMDQDQDEEKIIAAC